MENSTHNFKNKEILVSEIVRNNIISRAHTTTNGELNVDEMLLKYPNIKDQLEHGESIQYLAYKKGLKTKITLIFILLAIIIFGFISITKGLTNTWVTTESFIFILLLSSLPSFIGGLSNVFIFTSKSFILWKRGFKSIKIYYKDISCIKLTKANSEISYTIKGQDNLKITVTKSFYKNSLHSDILTILSEKIPLPEKEVAKNIKNIWIFLSLTILSDIIIIFLIYQLPYMRQPILFGYSGAFIASIWIAIFSFVLIFQIYFFVKKKYK